MQVDKGGIKFILNGANVMAPGLTSPGGKMDDVPENTVGNAILLFII
jgi:PUA domain protein